MSERQTSQAQAAAQVTTEVSILDQIVERSKLAKDDANNRFAVKIFGKDIDFQELMSAELETLKQCAHPNVIGLVGSGKGTQENSKKGDNSVHYIVLELA